MELLGDVDYVESRLVRLEMVFVLVQDLVHGLRQTFHRLRNHFGRTRW